MEQSKQKWTCVQNCGACCRLAPEERTEALEVLSDIQTKKYLEMVGPDGWCRHYDTALRSCTIYDDRPDFCKVDLLPTLFEIPLKEEEVFKISCCQQQIRSVYGGRSKEFRYFNKAIKKDEKNHE